MAAARSVNQCSAIEHSTRSTVPAATSIASTSQARRSARTRGNSARRSRNCSSIGAEASTPITLSTPSRGIAASEAKPVPQATSSRRG